MMDRINENAKITLTIKQLVNLVKESSEDYWLDSYLKKHPEALDDTLEYIKKKNPNMSDAGRMAYARNILKKKHREGEIKDDEGDENDTSNTPRTASPEDEERFVKEIKNWDSYESGNSKAPEYRWLFDKGISISHDKLRSGQASKLALFYKPVGFDGDGKVLLDVYSSKKTKEETDSDGDYDDGQNHSWTDIYITYTVDTKDKVGETTGELKDGNVVLSDGTVLVGWGKNANWNWKLSDKWTPSYRHSDNYWRPGGGGRRWRP